MRSISVSSTTRYFMAKIVFVYRPIATVSWKLWRASCVGQLVKKPARQLQPQPQHQPPHHSQFQIPGLIPRLNGGSALNLPFLWGASSEIENSGPRTFLAWITLWTTPPTRTHSSASKLSYTSRGEAREGSRNGPHEVHSIISPKRHWVGPVYLAFLHTPQICPQNALAPPPCTSSPPPAFRSSFVFMCAEWGNSWVRYILIC